MVNQHGNYHSHEAIELADADLLEANGNVRVLDD